MRSCWTKSTLSTAVLSAALHGCGTAPAPENLEVMAVGVTNSPMAPTDLRTVEVGVPAEWSSQVMSRIAAGEYTPQILGSRFHATNRAQNLRAWFDEDGLTLSSRVGEGELEFNLTGWGREGMIEAAQPTAPEEGPCLDGAGLDAFGQCLHRVQYVRPGVVEWWENRPEGLEQGFTVEAPPQGEGYLIFELGVSGAEVVIGEGGAQLILPSGLTWSYTGLVAYDVLGQELDSWMEESVTGLRLVVDDSVAIGPITVDPIITAQSWSAQSDQTDARFGSALSSAGDVNGDGYGDVVVGAPLYDNGQTDEGRVFLYTGSASGLSPVAVWSAEGDQARARFGHAVALAGDVNGDGFSDVIVGSPDFDGATADEGAAFVFLGSASGLGATPAWRNQSGQTGASYGSSVSSAGDLNGDGFSDVVVGAPNYDNAQADEGQIFVYLGGAPGLGQTASWTDDSDQVDAHLGCSVSAGDVNGDGFSDLVVGAYGYDRGEEGEGAVFIYHGTGFGVSAPPSTHLEVNQGYARFGWAVASLGDTNGDGYADVAAGAPSYDRPPTSNLGAVFVFHGSSSGVASPAVTVVGGDESDIQWGASLASAGDINGDGYGDLLVGAYLDSNGQLEEGLAYLFLGSAGGIQNKAAWKVETNQPFSQAGAAVASAGDVNGDGFGDVMVGANLYDGGQTDEGAAFLFLGSGAGLSTTAGQILEGDQVGGYLGSSLASAGDVNGDGYTDVIVGAESYDNGQNSEGRAFLYLGSSTGLGTTPSWTAESDQGFAYFGHSVASAGDVNADGYADVLVGAFRYDTSKDDGGRIYLYTGSASGLSPTPTWKAELHQGGANLGASVASAGDVDGDGYDDIVAGAPGYDGDQANEGQVLLFRGTAGGMVLAWDMESNQAGSNFGESVASAGDVNGDGFSDVVVGAPTYDGREEDSGAAFLYLGSPTGLGTLAATSMDFNQAFADYGDSVASAGDVNGDGFGDVVVGAPGVSITEYSEGQAFLYLGSALGLNTTAAWSAAPGVPFAGFGATVASAGDVNGDGLGDVIVGAPNYSQGHNAEGAAYVYLGGSGGLSSGPAWWVESNVVGAYLGSSVASAGDVNGDGFGDVVVGLPKSTSAGGTAAEGRVHVYFGNSGDNTVPLSRVPQARQSGGNTPIPPGLVTLSESAFDVVMLKARGAWGRGPVKLQVESRPMGVDFSYPGLATAGGYTSSGLGGVNLKQGVAGLSRATGYHWRARVLSSPTLGYPQGWGPWVYGGGSGNVKGGHVFTPGYLLYRDADGDGYGAAEGTVIRAPSWPGFVTNSQDCDDTSAQINPNAVESCNGLDDNCDGLVDDRSASGQTNWYQDGDDDGYGKGAPVVGCDPPLGYVANSGDCDDNTPTINPEMTEVCDGIDNNCDGVVDGSDAVGQSAWYVDEDGDGYGAGVGVVACEGPPGSAPAGGDCDDTSVAVNPGLVEVCDDADLDEDCSGAADNNDAGASPSTQTPFYLDTDQDGYGSATSIMACDPPAGYSPLGNDCDDAVSGIHPGAPDPVGDEVDSNCDTTEICYVDVDGDSYRPNPVQTVTSADADCSDVGEAAATLPLGDCDDSNPAIHPNATEIAGDEVDQNCDGGEICYLDQDDDGYVDGAGVTLTSLDTDCDDAGEALATAPAGDCHDGDAAFHPGAEESNCADPTDYNCDGSAGDQDNDGDGYAACSECNDTQSNVFPGATEVAGDGVDQNCDGKEDCYVDQDNDGYVPAGSPVVSSTHLSCDGEGEAGAGGASGDCDDLDPGVHPDAVEAPGDEVDQNCDGIELCYVDGDNDGYSGEGGATVVSPDPSCEGEGEASSDASSGDCDDTRADIHPGASEINCADPIDYNCDGSVGLTDGDGDGYAACEECNDAELAVNPDAPEVCNHLDDDCDGVTDDDAVDMPNWSLDGDGDGFTNPDDTLSSCDAPEGYLPPTVDDCDDLDASVYPGAIDIPDDGIDQDCDGVDADGAPGDEDDTSEEATPPSDGDGCGCDTSDQPLSVGWWVMMSSLWILMCRRASPGGGGPPGKGGSTRGGQHPSGEPGSVGSLHQL